MYTEYFGLAAPLVQDGIARDDQVFHGEVQRRVETDLRLALSRSESVALIYGPPGTGKSTLAASALRESATQLAIGCLTDVAQTAHELLEQLLLEFGFSPYKMSRTERLTQWREYLGEMATTGTRVGVVVENAERFDPTILAELERLTSADIRGITGANLLLTARSPLTAFETTEELTALCQRCRTIVHVEPLSATQTCDYIRFRMIQAGADWDSLAETGVDMHIHTASGGIIRLIDNVLESSLARGTLERSAQLTNALVDRVAATMPGAHPRRRSAAEIAPPDTGVTSNGSAPNSVAEGPGAASENQPEAVSDVDSPLTAPPETPEPQNRQTTHPPGAPAVPETSEKSAIAQVSARESAAPSQSAKPARTAEPLLIEPQPKTSTTVYATADPAAQAAASPREPEPPIEIPVLEDAVVTDDHAIEVQASESDNDWQAHAIEIMLAADAPAPVADTRSTAATEGNDRSPVETLVEEHEDLSDEDRQQIEMLEAFANAEALEEMSESLAETIFGNALADKISESILQAMPALTREAEDPPKDQRPADGIDGPPHRLAGATRG